MKQKLFTLLTLLLCLCSTAWATSYIPTTVKTISTTQNFIIAGTGSNADNTEVAAGIEEGWIVIPSKGYSSKGVATDPDNEIPKPSNNAYCLTVKKDGGVFNSQKRVIHMLVTGITGVKAIGNSSSSNGFQIGATEYTDGMSESTAMNIVAGSSSANNPVSCTGLSAKKTYIISIFAYNGDTYLYAVRFTAGATDLDDPGLSASPSSATLSVGGSQQITASATSGGTISYTSSNTNVATVSNTGLITAVGIGNATITTTVAATGSYDTDSKLTTIIVKPADLTITKYATFDNALSSSPSGYFTISESGTTTTQYNTKFAGTYAGTDYGYGLKFQNGTTVNFTTTTSCDLVVVQSLWSDQLIKIDGTTFSRNYDTQTYYDDATNKVRVYTIKNLAAGSHSITRNSEFGMLYIGVTEPLAPSLSVSPTSASAFAYVVDNGPSDPQTFTVTGSNLTATVTATLSNTDAYEMRTGENAFAAGPLTDLASGTAVQVRLKSGLAKGDSYNGNLTFSSTGADNKVVALTGSVTGQTYTVTYNLNGASGDAPTQAATEEGGKFNLAAAPTRTCYTFNGWKCNVDNVTYAANDEYTMTAAPTTFTAQWTANYSTSLDFSAVVLAKINDETEPPAIATFLAGGNMVAENLGSSAWETGSGWGSTIKTGFLGYKLKTQGAKVSFLAPAGKLVTIVLGSIAANVTLSKNGTTSTISSKSGDDAETIVTPFVTGEDMLVSLTTTSGGTVTLKKIIISDYATATISAAEYATFYNADKALDFSTTGITVYTAQDKETSVGLTEIESGKVPANTPVVLYKAGADGTAFNVPVIASAAAIEGTNDLRVSTGTDVDYMYVLAMNPTIGFYPWTGTNLPAGKIYLQGKASYGAREFLGFDANTTTSIDNVVVKTIDENAPMYNLAGQRVTKSYKGVVIVNGKKYMNK